MSTTTASPKMRVRRKVGGLALAGAAILIWLSWIDRPDPPDGTLDASWHAVLGYAHQAGWAFGREIIFTHGPWGWLTSHYLMEDGLTGKWLWEVFGKLFFASGAVLLSLRLPLWRRILFLLLLPATGLFFPDTHFVTVICLGVAFGLMAEKVSFATAAIVVLAIGFLSTMKFVYAVAGMSGIGFAVVARIAERRWREGAMLTLGAACSFLLAWLLSGQPLVHLSDHFRMSLELSTGYGAAMSLDPSKTVFFAGAAATLVFLASCGLAMRDPVCRCRIWPLAAYLAFVAFVMWKHGFTRADGHVFALFSHVILVGICAAPALEWRRRWDPFLVSVAAGAMGMFAFNASLVSNAPLFIKRHLGSGSDYVLHPSTAREAYQHALAAQRARAAMQEVAKSVGDASIDAINYHQGVLLLNDMNYVSRPVIQSYPAFTPALLRRNWRFIQSERAPDFLLWRQGTIDGRFPSQDDSLLLTEIPRRYEFVRATSQGTLLGKRTIKPAQRDPVFDLFVEQPLAWGQTFSLPQAPDAALWMEVVFGTSAVGKLRGAIYKPGRINTIVTDSEGRETAHRIVKGITKAGFLIHPFLETQEDIDLLMHGKARLAIHSMRFEPAHQDERELWTGIHIRLYRIPEIPALLEAPFYRYEQTGITNHPPLTVSSGIAVEVITNETPNRVLVHPPGEMVFDIDAETRCLSGSFGIREGAYTGSGATDGVTFTIQAEAPGGERTKIWTRTLHPLTDEADRGLQHFQACAPEDATRLFLLSTAGEKNNTDWDWAYWAELRFGP
ncbi:MAG: hypothetical protein ACREIA_18860 [Opitutaceae bacterium]